ncbi:MAG: hypothetical protein ACYSW8_29660 [Planctomycetota bacterium]|jgi:hypothetical protein
MACEYWYDGLFRTEEEFKSILENGLLDQLIRDKKVSLDAFEIDPTKIKNGAKKEPISLKVLRKIDSNINNKIDPKTGAHLFQNPLGAIKDFNNNQKNKKKDLKLKFAIKVGNKVYTGEGKENLALAQELNDTAVRQSGLNVAESLQEGAVYMLVPSSYGIYPIKIFTNKVKDTELKGDLKKMLLELKRGDKKMVDAVNDFFLKNFYRLTAKDEKSSGVVYDSKKDTFYITRFSPETKQFVTKEFKTVDDAFNFLGDLLYRVDYTKINKGNYNIKVAENNAVKTDVFVEDGSFFHSPSLVIQAYTMSNEDSKKQQKVLELFVPTEKLNSSEVTSQQANKNKKNKSEETQGLLFNTPAINLKELAEKKKVGKVDYTPKGKTKQTYTIDYSEKTPKILNNKGKEVFKKDSGDRRAIFAKFAVNENRAVIVTHKNKKYVVSNKNKDIFSVATKKIMQWGPKNGDRIAILDLYEKKLGTQKPVETKTETKLPPGLSKNTEQPDVTQDLSSIIPGATPIESPITYEDSSTDWDQFSKLTEGAEDFNRNTPNEGKKELKI